MSTDTTTCSCGCCNNSLTPGCTYTSGLDVTCQEYLCSAGFYQGSFPTPCTGSDTIQPGDPFNIVDLEQIWSGQQCEQFYQDKLFSAGGGQAASCDTLKSVQTDMNHFLKAYESVGGDFTSANSSNLQQTLIQFCANRTIAPGVCDLYLGTGSNTTGYCGNFTRDQIGGDETLNSACGCYAPPAGVDLPQASCDSICHLTGVVQRPDPKTAGKTDSCPSTVCVIDDVNINLVNTTTRSAFSQICGACTETNPCTCIISGVNVNDTMSKSGIGPVYEQVCGPSQAQCYNTSSGTTQLTTCPPATQFATPTTNVTFPIVLIIIVTFVILMFIVIFLITGHTKTEVEGKEISQAQAQALSKQGVQVIRQ